MAKPKNPKPPPQGDTASARARALREERVDRIVNLMSRGEWKGARSHRDLAALWNVSIHAVAEYAREASGIVRRVVQDDPESIRAEIIAGIEAVRVTALSLQKPMLVAHQTYDMVQTPDCGNALKAYELRAKMLGLVVDRAETKVEVKGSAPATEAEELAELRELSAQMAARIAELEGKEALQ